MTNAAEKREIEIVDRPVYYGQKGRALVWYYRALSAYNLAARIDGEQVSREEYDAAAKLLDSCQRFALADAHQWEYVNSSCEYCNSERRKEDERRLNARREALQKRLARYGIKMEYFGLYPSLCYTDPARKYERVFGVSLYYFD